MAVGRKFGAEGGVGGTYGWLSLEVSHDLGRNRHGGPTAEPTTARASTATTAATGASLQSLVVVERGAT